GDRRVGDHLAGVADHEEVAEALVEDDLGGETRVAAAEQHRVRVLRDREVLATLDILTRVTRLACDEALVAAQHLLPDLGWGAGGCGHESSLAVAVASVMKSASWAVPEMTIVRSSSSATRAYSTLPG